MKKYWEDEEPLVAETKKNVFRLYRESEKLQVSTPDWLDDDGNKKSGKTVTIDLAVLRDTDEALNLLAQAIER